MSKQQPAPTPNGGTPIWDLVIADMKARDQMGRKKYGTPLQAHNGRDFLQDAYEESLDQTVYLRGALEERKTLGASRPEDMTGVGHDSPIVDGEVVD